MGWPFRRFVKAFDAFQRRVLCDEWRHRKSVHLAALHANSNLDSEQNDRPAIVEKLEQAYDNVIVRIWNGPDGEEFDTEAEEAWNDDFMRAGRRSLESSMAAIKPPQMPGEASIGALPSG